MTLAQAIEVLDTALPNVCSMEEKCRWLTELDGMVWVLILGNAGAFPGYTPDSDPDTELLAQPPFDDIYRYRLEAQVHYGNGEAVRCNNAIAMFRAAWERLAAHHLRTNPPPKTSFKF